MHFKLKYHIIAWLGYLAFESYIEFAWISKSYAALPPLTVYLRALSAESTLLLIKIPVSYAVLWFFDRHAENRKSGRLLLNIFVTLVAGVILYRITAIKIILPYQYGDTVTEPIFDLNRFITTFLDLIFVAGVAVALIQYSMNLRWREREKNLLKEKLEAELNFLKAQTNPHFLFNTLNNIYGLARNRSEHTADLVMRLSKILRYMLYESHNEKVPVTEEVKNIENYIAIHKIRFSERLHLAFETDIDNKDYIITPLLLLPFIENAFKHGAAESRFDIRIFISLTIRNNDLTFIVSNSIEPDKHKQPSQEGIGLKNVTRQLELLYPTHSLKTENSGDNFKILLHIPNL